MYACQSSYIKDLNQAFNGDPAKDIDKKMMKDISSVDPDCVVINWECSSSYSDSPFPEGVHEVESLVAYSMKKGFMAMFSDFSLKALIASWPLFNKE